MRLAELTLDDMLADPIVRLVMQRDGVEEAQVRRLIDVARCERAAREGGRPANDCDGVQTALARQA